MPSIPCPGWRLLLSGPLTAAMNMALDEAVFEDVAGGSQPPTLRLYGWSPPAVSLGYFQRLEDSVNLDALHARGYDLVRRPTGGRAILHHLEVTYSVSIRVADLGVGEGVLRSYKALSRGLEAGLRSLGVPAAIPPDRSTPAPTDQSLHAVCFARTAAGDMAIAGRKIVGSAQMRRAGAILQHGSVPLTINAEDHAQVLCPAASPNAAAGLLRRTVTGVAEVLDRDVSFAELAGALAAGFRDALGVTLSDAPLAHSEVSRAEDLVRTRYADDGWNTTPGRRERG